MIKNIYIRLALANIRKSKGQSVSFAIIIVLSALMLTCGLVTALDYDNNFEKKADEWNSPDASYQVQGADVEHVKRFEELLLADGNTEEVEILPVLYVSGSFRYGEGEQSRGVVFLDRETMPELGQWSVLEEDAALQEHGIYLPYLFKFDGSYEIGDTFEVSASTWNIPKVKLSFTVAGFYEDTYFSTINNSVTGYLLSEGAWKYMEDTLGEGAAGSQIAVKLKDGSKAEGYVTQYYAKLQEIAPQGSLLNSHHFDVIKSARTVTSSIGASIIVGFSLLVLLISLVVVKFRIGNSIEEEMQNIGALKALGYTGQQIMGGFLLQFMLLALAGTAAGMAAAYSLLPVLSSMFAAQTGVLWQPGISAWTMVLVIAGVEVPVMMVAAAASWKIKSLPPMAALRSGIYTHNFKRNAFPLSSSKGSLILHIAGKQMFLNIKKNLLIGTIVAGVTFAAVFAGVLYYSIKVDFNGFLTLTMGEFADAVATASSAESAEVLLAGLRDKEQVEEAFYMYENTVTSEEDKEAYCYISDDFELATSSDWNYKGRFPVYDNEVSIGGLLAGLLDKDIGDKIVLSAGEGKEEYLITGFIQGTNYMGHDLCMTSGGYRRMVEDFQFTSINVHLKEGEAAEDFIRELEESPLPLASVRNKGEAVRSSMGIYQNIVGILVVVIDIVTMAIVGLVLYLVIKTLLIRQKRSFAIQKAIGFTTGQLAMQNALAFLPVIAGGGLLGCMLGYVGVNPFVSLLFAGIGLLKVNFAIPFMLLAGTFAAVTGIGFGIALWVSFRIRKVSPCALVSE